MKMWRYPKQTLQVLKPLHVDLHRDCSASHRLLGTRESLSRILHVPNESDVIIQTSPPATAVMHACFQSQQLACTCKSTALHWAHFCRVCACRVPQAVLTVHADKAKASKGSDSDDEDVSRRIARLKNSKRRRK